MSSEEGVIEGAAVEDRCAHHPERAGDPCSRCGTFVCEACRAEGVAPPLCAACRARLDEGRFVSRVPLLGIATMIHGGLVLGLGAMLFGYGLFIGRALGRQAPAPALQPGLDPDAFGGAVVGILIGVGAVHIVVGALQLWAGWRIRAYRGRWLGLGALAAGLVTAFGCYCAPTSIGLLIWGAVFLLSRDVADRFELERSRIGAMVR